SPFRGRIVCKRSSGRKQGRKRPPGRRSSVTPGMRRRNIEAGVEDQSGNGGCDRREGNAGCRPQPMVSRVCGVFFLLSASITYFGLAGSGGIGLESFNRATASLLNLIL